MTCHMSHRRHPYPRPPHNFPTIPLSPLSASRALGTNEYSVISAPRTLGTHGDPVISPFRTLGTHEDAVISTIRTIFWEWVLQGDWGP